MAAPLVAANHEEKHSIWMDVKDITDDRHTVGKTENKEAYLYDQTLFIQRTILPGFYAMLT